ncbi:hypothetical protein I7648_00340 [Collinsella tanakaei]|nr:hypothetical protein [Collinsella tanakaei]
MSIGYGDYAHLIYEQDGAALYTYHAYDLNDPVSKAGYDHVIEDDGSFVIMLDEAIPVEVEPSRFELACRGYALPRIACKLAYCIEDQRDSSGSYPEELAIHY